MTEQPAQDATVDLTKAAVVPPAVPDPPVVLPDVVAEPVWSGSPPTCPRCARGPVQHRNGARWWECWELDAIHDSHLYWSLTRRERRARRLPRPPELRPNPSYVPATPYNPRHTGSPTHLVQPGTFWQYLKAHVGRRA